MLQELPNIWLGIGIMGFIDCTSSNSDEQGIPDPLKYKEACLKFLRTVSMGAPTTANHFSTNLDKFVDKMANYMKKTPVVFPDFSAPARTGWCLLINPQQGHA